MRVKPVPEPPDAVEAVERIREAVPLVPEPEASCCDRLAARTDVDAEDARDWLMFLRGVGLVREGETGYHRTREDPDLTERRSVGSRMPSDDRAERGSAGSPTESDDLAEALLSGVYGACEVYALLDPREPLTAEEVFECFEAVPRWERHRNPDWEALWHERIERLLGWLVLVGLAERRENGYVSRSGSRP